MDMMGKLHDIRRKMADVATDTAHLALGAGILGVDAARGLSITMADAGRTVVGKVQHKASVVAANKRFRTEVKLHEQRCVDAMVACMVASQLSADAHRWSEAEQVAFLNKVTNGMLEIRRHLQVANELGMTGPVENLGICLDTYSQLSEEISALIA